MADRKNFPTSTFAAYLKGENVSAQQSIIDDMLAFMTKKDGMDDEFRPFASALAKAYIYEQHPELAAKSAAEVSEVGSSVSVAPLPGVIMTQVDEVFAKLADYHATIADQTAKLSELETKLAEATSKLAETEKLMADYKGKYEALEAGAKGQGESCLVVSQSKLDEYTGKVDELLKMVDNLKSGIAAVPAAAGGAAVAAAASGPVDSPGEVSDDFGFGTDSGSGDGFGF